MPAGSGGAGWDVVSGVAQGPTHVARLEFPRETGLILRCARKVGNPLQTEKGSRPSCRNQERRRGEGERVLALESREGTRASRRVEEGLSRS